MGIQRHELAKAIDLFYDAHSLKTLLFEHFPAVDKELVPGLYKSDWIQLLLTHVEQGHEEKLLEVLKRERPHLDWEPYFSKDAPINPLPKPKTRLVIVIVLVFFFGITALQGLLQNRFENRRQQEPAGEVTIGEPIVRTPVGGETAVNPTCPPNSNGRPDPFPADTQLPESYYPPASLTWENFPELLDPTQRRQYIGQIGLGEQFEADIVGKVPDMCMTHIYLFESEVDALVNFTLSDTQGFGGQGYLVFHTKTQKEVDSNQAISSPATITQFVLASEQYLIEIFNFNFNGGSYTFSVTEAE